MQKSFVGLLIFIALTLGCRQETAVTTPRPSATDTVLPSPQSKPDMQVDSRGVLSEIINPTRSFKGWPWPIAPLPDLVRTAVTPAQRQSMQALSQPAAPERDDAQLAQVYGRLQSTPPAQPGAADNIPIGSEAVINISQNKTNHVIPVEAVLLGVSEHAYFWFDTGPGSVQPAATAVETMGSIFDEIYQQVAEIYGQTAPGLDGDPRVHIVTASPLALCNVTLSTTDHCGLAGYFNSSDTLPATVNPNSNERNMFVMNADWFGTDFYLNVLTHEFRHLIEDNYDRGEEEWEIEGSATLAEDLLGFPDGARQRANRFLENPNRQLNSWTNSDKIPHYGQGYLFNRYLYDQLGEAYYREFVQHPANGLHAIDAIAAEHNLPLSGEQLWLDWLAALAIHNHPQAPPAYRFQDSGIDQASATTITRLPKSIEGQVYQYGANYYRLPAAEKMVLQFTGSTAVPTLPLLPASGDMMWVSERGNFHNPRLTRSFDLTAVDNATLEYAAYIDMEQGFDFGYVAVSTDDGRRWQPLIAPGMAGLDPGDDPANTALANRFYTGSHPAWMHASVDLSPYAGQVIQIRFEYVTDPAINYNGFALDNIAIPEIGFYDDTETVMSGWNAEGFRRVTAYLPQTWHLQLITFPDGIPNITNLPLQPDQTGAYLLEIQANEDNPILIVAASAPHTLQPAFYQLSVSSKQ